MAPAALLCGVLVACSAVQPKFCTLIGVVPGVNFDASAVTNAHPGKLSAIACVAGACTTATIGTRDAGSHIRAGSDSLEGSGPHEVSLKIRDVRGTTVFEARNRVVLRKTEPNGPGCPPVAWMGGVRATENGTLEPIAPDRP